MQVKTNTSQFIFNVDIILCQNNIKSTTQQTKIVKRSSNW